MKNMMKKLPFIALICGGAALGIRYWLLETGVDGKGLIVSGHPGDLLTYVLMAVALVGFLLLVRPLPKDQPYPFGRSIPGAAGSALAGAAVLYTAVAGSSTSGMLGTLTLLLGIGAGGALLYTGYARLKGLRPSYYLHALVTVYLMVYILSQYRGWTTEPQIQVYMPQLLAAVCLMITAYYRATLDFGYKTMRCFLFYNAASLFFCCAAIYGSNPVLYAGMALWTLTVDCSTPETTGKAKPMTLPENVCRSIKALEDQGFTAYAVGGCVRDHLLGITPHDYDLCTSAKPEDICRIFEEYELVRSGEKHGTIGVVMDGQVYEITTYRLEGGYSDSRHPDWVEFVGSIEEDLSRRDFTVNAMAYSPTRGYADPYGGEKDLENKVLRAVGKAELRFREDALRILRGVRFAARFGLEPEAQTMEAMLSCAPLMESLAWERVYSELMGFLPLADAQSLIRFAPILTQVIPELAPCLDFDQKNPHHIYDVYTHTAHTVAAVEADPAVRMAALLHDIGKPACFTLDEKGCGHFYDHAKVGAQMADQILARLKAPNALRREVVTLVAGHMDLFDADKKKLQRRMGQYGVETTRKLIQLHKADLIATGTAEEEALARYDRLEQLMQEILDSEACLKVKDLAIDGSDLMALGMESGPAIGDCLTRLLELVMEEKLPNRREELLAAAQEMKE